MVWAQAPQAFKKLCKAEGIAYRMVDRELKQKRVTRNSHVGIAYKQRRMAELRGTTTMDPEVGKMRPGVQIMPEREWVARVTPQAGTDGVADGAMDAKSLWEAACYRQPLIENEFGEMGLPVNVTPPIQSSLLSRQSETVKEPLSGLAGVDDGLSAAEVSTQSGPPSDAATSIGSMSQHSEGATADAGADDEQQAIHSPLMTRGSGDHQPASGASLAVSSEEVAEMKARYLQKISGSVQGLGGQRGLFARAKRIFDTLSKRMEPKGNELRASEALSCGKLHIERLGYMRRLVEIWSPRTVREEAAKVDTLLGELAKCRGTVEEDILTNMRGSP